MREKTPQSFRNAGHFSSSIESLVPIDSRLLPVLHFLDKIIISSTGDTTHFSDPIVTVDTDGYGQNWTWVKSTPFFSTAYITSRLDQEYQNDVVVKVGSHIQDRSSKDQLVEWGKVWEEGRWDIDAVLRDEVTKEQLRHRIKNALHNSWEDMDDCEMIIEAVRKKAGK